jgi:hypothetical protein
MANQEANPNRAGEDEKDEEYFEMLRVFKKIKILPQASKEEFLTDYNEVIQPEDDGTVKEELDLLEQIHSSCLPKLLRLEQRFPPEAHASVGTSFNPSGRMLQYDQRAEYYKRTDVEPPIIMEELILYRSNNRANCLAVEFYLQHHLQNGLWKGHFEGRVNPHDTRPPVKKDHDVRACYVYARYSKVLSTWQVIDKSMESGSKAASAPTSRPTSSAAKPPPAAKARPTTRSAAASKPMSDIDDSPIKRPTKRTPRKLESASEDSEDSPIKRPTKRKARELDSDPEDNNIIVISDDDD